MFEKILSKKTKKVLALLSKAEFRNNFYLAGVTGLALQIGHRISNDLDFFNSQTFNTKKIIKDLSQLGQFIVEQEDKNTINGELNGVKLSLFFYRHNLIRPSKKFFGIQVANPIDIALMKITAIGSRGSKKDFIDLYFINQKIISLKKLFRLLSKKFKQVKYEPYHLILGLTYFKNADKEPMPQMLSALEWEDVKRYFEKQAIQLIQETKPEG